MPIVTLLRDYCHNPPSLKAPRFFKLDISWDCVSISDSILDALGSFRLARSWILAVQLESCRLQACYGRNETYLLRHDILYHTIEKVNAIVTLLRHYYHQTRHPVPHSPKAKCPSWHYCGTTIITHLVSKHLGFLDLTYPKTVYLFRFHPCFSGFSDTTPKQATCTLLSDACLSLQPQGLLYLWGALRTLGCKPLVVAGSGGHQEPMTTSVARCLDISC